MEQDISELTFGEFGEYLGLIPYSYSLEDRNGKMFLVVPDVRE